MALPTTYDRLIAQLASEGSQPAVPVDFVKAVIKGESDFNPASLDSRSGASGLLAITKPPLTDYNASHGTKWTLADMRSGDGAAEKALRVGIWALRFIVGAMARSHPLSLSPNWTSRAYAELLVLGWNAGFSEAAGLGKVVGYLERNGQPVDLEHVLAAQGKIAGVVDYVFMPARHAFARGVAATYWSAVMSPTPAAAPSPAAATPAAAPSPAAATPTTSPATSSKAEGEGLKPAGAETVPPLSVRSTRSSSGTVILGAVGGISAFALAALLLGGDKDQR